MAEIVSQAPVSASPVRRTYPAGAEVLPGEGTHFRVWAPSHKRVDVVIGEAATPLEREAGGYFSAFVKSVDHGALYRFRLDGGDAFPDPASRFQPEGPHGPSMVVDPKRYRWRADRWRQPVMEDAVIYELHIGTFTREGTYEAAKRQLPALADLGVNTLELMPLAEFPGRFGWGYDGVQMYAPYHHYGSTEGLRDLIDSAHEIGLNVILDVVYNHFGPDGNYAGQYSEAYFTRKYENEWGDALNFDGPGSEGARDYFAANASYWIAEYRFDGLRLDATQSIHDASKEHLIARAVREAREAAGERSIIVVAENETQEAVLVTERGVDALWNDDFHHSSRVALTGHRQAYYSDYRGASQEFLSAIKYGFLYQGQRYQWQKKGRGRPALRLKPRNFVTYIQNHDQVANSARGLRIHALTSPAELRAMTAVLLLAPPPPMLFQGQEFASSAPFLYFADNQTGLAEAVRTGRVEFLAQFRNLRDQALRPVLADPESNAAFESCKLDFAEREKNAEAYALHRDLLRLRRTDPVISRHGASFDGTPGFDGAVLSADAFLLRFFDSEDADRLLLFNLGGDLHLDPAPEPLLAPVAEKSWRTMWSSEDPVYGGEGRYPVYSSEGWRIPARAAVLLAPADEEPEAIIVTGARE